MKYKRLIYVCLLVVVGLVVNIRQSFADPTVKEILEKKIANDKARNTMECKVINEWSSPEDNKVFESTGYLWMKGKDRYRLEIYDSAGKVENTTIVNSTATVIINNLGTYIVDKREDQDVKVNLSEGEIIEENTDKFLEYFSCSIKEANGDIYTIKMIPTPRTVVYNQVSKIEETIDYSKGCEIKGIIYDLSSKPIVTTDFSDFQSFNGVWMALQKSTKTISEGNTAIINVIKYEGLKINEGIDDSIFDIEIPEEVK